MKAFTLTAALVAILALGVNGRGAGRGDPSSGDSGEIDEPGCCYGSDVKCQIPDTKATCDKQARKGCEWISGDDADCTPPTAEPGCCAGGGVCEDADNDYCVNNRGAKKAGCAWIGGEDADCAPLPGCCYGTSSVCWDATQSSCASRTAKKAGCAWIEGTTDAPPDCTPPTPEPGCCAGEGVCEDADNDYCVNNRMAKKAGCEWLSGKDANCETTTTSTPATTAGEPQTTWGGPSDSAEGGLTLICDGDRECYGQKVNCPDTGACTIQCTGQNACERMVVNCPDNNLCDITCVDDRNVGNGWSCAYAKFNWAATPGLGSLTCEGETMCLQVDFPEPEPTESVDIVCTDFRECNDAKIYCPADADCSLTCVAERSCDGVTLVCPDEHECVVDCQCDADDSGWCGSYASCWNMNVKWPSKEGMGELKCADRGIAGDSCTGVNVPEDSWGGPSHGDAEEQMEFDAVGSPVQSALILNDSLVLFVGASAALFALLIAFYVCARRSKEVAVPWDDEQ